MKKINEHNLWKWTTCFIEWKDKDDDKMSLSAIPWHVLIDGILARITGSNEVDFEWHWVPPWRVNIVKD